MKKPQDELTDELRPEYDLKGLLRIGSRGKYAERYREGTNLILLEPDVAKAFPDPQAVNNALRLVLKLTKIPTAGGACDGPPYAQAGHAPGTRLASFLAGPEDRPRLPL